MDKSFEQEFAIATGKLNQVLGDDLVNLLVEGLAGEIMLNPNGLILVRYKDGEYLEHGIMSFEKAQMAIRTMASLYGENIDEQRPILDGKIEVLNTRFCAVLPPICKSPVFCMRTLSALSFTLDDFIGNKFLSKRQALILISLLENKENLIICGQTSSGKTSFLNALLQRIAHDAPQTRFVTIEDTPELKIKSSNVVNLYTNKHTNMSDLVKASLRLSPERLIVGEVRSAEALDMVDALSTGHSGGIASIHAGSAKQCLERLRLLISRNESAPENINSLITLSINIIVVLKTIPYRHVHQIMRVTGFKDNQFLFEELT